MDLRDAVSTVWNDVGDSVYRNATASDAVRFARDELANDELAAIANDDDDVNVYDAYVVVRNASQVDLDPIVRELDDNNAG